MKYQIFTLIFERNNFFLSQLYEHFWMISYPYKKYDSKTQTVKFKTIFNP